MNSYRNCWEIKYVFVNTTTCPIPSNFSIMNGQLHDKSVHYRESSSSGRFCYRRCSSKRSSLKRSWTVYLVLLAGIPAQGQKIQNTGHVDYFKTTLIPSPVSPTPTTSTTTTPGSPPQSPIKPVVNHHRCDNSRCTAPVPTKLNVHLVPHTHDDVGWLKTVDQYYYGSQSHHKVAGVHRCCGQSTGGSSTSSTAFFWKWWRDQSEEHRTQVRALVNEGRLEFISGGWVMHDEANTHYQSIIDQMTWGHRRLQDMIGPCVVPTIGWQIDPFGHSRESAHLSAMFGFDGLFFARLDYQDKKLRSAEQRMEFIWQGSGDVGRSANIWTHVMAGPLYGPPTGFDWEGDGEPIIDDPESDDYNVNRIVDKFLDYVSNYSANYATNQLFIPMAHFHPIQSANNWFTNMDKLIRYVNGRQRNGSNINVFYSTPTCYLSAVHQSNNTLTTKADDFFPYASDGNTYWTGYYTSRPALKRYERVGNNFLQACKQLDVLAGMGGVYDKEVTALREWQAVMQHHDAITGTEKQHVASDYALKLAKSIAGCERVVNRAVAKLAAKSMANRTVQSLPEQLFCQQLNVSACEWTESLNTSLAVTVYNPYGQPVRHILRLPITNRSVQVLDPTGAAVNQTYVFPIPGPVLSLNERDSEALEELVFEAPVPALGFVTYTLKLQDADDSPIAPVVRKVVGDFSVQTPGFDVFFDRNGRLQALRFRDSGRNVSLRQEFAYYSSHSGTNSGPDRASGAYIFLPEPKEFATDNVIAPADCNYRAQVVESPVLTEVHHYIQKYLSQVIRIDHRSDTIEIDYTCGPIPVADESGKEIVFRWQTDLNTGGVFYTDSNGRQTMRRRRDYRPTYKLNVTQPVSGNYYPVNNWIAIWDEVAGLQLTMLNDRAQGGTGFREGQIELMVHRRILHDDGIGVDEPLDEPGVDGNGLTIRGRFWLQLATVAAATELHRELANRLMMEPVVTFNRLAKGQAPHYYKKHRTNYTALYNPLPRNIHLLTLERWANRTLLLRLEHFYQWNESREWSAPARVELRDVFREFVVYDAVETTLSATENILTTRRLQFRYTNANNHLSQAFNQTHRFEPKRHELNTTDLSVIINPMEIRTFIVRIKPKYYCNM
ncbi:unnamed protein product [Medioppia subpectinata]|uniref:Alpha-mannosidase n=1 Tax=Medioppia subpectinata TaxID=1979941 RepID=A0A7R9PZJ1_9ACAR|nr:unnamed protein product [Medioppia subpectinata]CAG2107047.1 unnamed protein product [Medioppia subpectinata]